MNGVLIVNKPKEFTSQDVVSKVKKILNEKKAGHTGTLDPLATGVLPVMIGNATKLSKYLIEHDKTYVATLKLGEKRDTGDSEGNIVEEKAVPQDLSRNKIEEVLVSFLGKQKQKPPMYSAIKVNGKKLYEYARAGQEVEIKPREIEIYDIELLNIDNSEKEIKFIVACSKGTYIRSLCEDIAEKLCTVGYMKELNRTKVGKFIISQAITIEQLEKNKNSINFLQEHIITMKELFKSYDKIYLNDKEIQKFLNGVKIHTQKQDGLYNIYNKDSYIGLAIVKDNFAKRDLINCNKNVI